MTFRHQARRASRARLALSLTALIWVRHLAPPAARAQVVLRGPNAAAGALAVAEETPVPVSTTTAATLEVDPTPPPTETPTATDPPQPPSETTTSPSESQENTGGSPVPPSTPPPETLDPAAEPAQTRLRAQFRVSGAGASAAVSGGTRDAFLDALAAGSSDPTLPRSSLSILRVAPAFVPLPSDSKRKMRKNRRQLLLLDPIGDTSDILVEVDASALNLGPSSANAQAAYTSVRNAAYSGLIQTSLRATGRRWAVVLTYAAAATPGAELLPAEDDSCERRFSKSSCLDGTGLTPAAAKGIIAAGVLVVLLALAFAGVAWDRRARAEGFGTGTGNGNGKGKTGKMADLAGSPRAAASAAGLTAIPLPPPPRQQANAAAAPGAALAIGEAPSSSSSRGATVAGAISSSSGKIKAER